MPAWLVKLVMVAAAALMAHEIFEAGRETGEARALYGEMARRRSEALGG